MRFGILWEFYSSSIGILWECYDWEHHRYIMGLPKDKYGDTLDTMGIWECDLEYSEHFLPGVSRYYYIYQYATRLSRYGQICPDSVRYAQLWTDSPNVGRYAKILPDMPR